MGRLILRLFIHCLLVLAATGCSTFDPSNNESQPWNRPTKADASQSWWIRNWDQQESLIEYP